jgi:hypothetical protein
VTLVYIRRLDGICLEVVQVSLDPDGGARPKFGVVVSLLELEDGSSRIIIDDVKSSESQRETTWVFDCFCTHKRVDSKELDAMTLPRDEYQRLGEAVIARLLALNGRVAP